MTHTIQDRLRDSPHAVRLTREAADALDALEAERDELQNRIKELGDMIHKRGNDIAVLRWENKKLRKALEALVSLNDDHGPFGGDLYRDRVDRAWESARTALKETDT